MIGFIVVAVGGFWLLVKMLEQTLEREYSCLLKSDFFGFLPYLLISISVSCITVFLFN